jgi:hypothetical protein
MILKTLSDVIMILKTNDLLQIIENRSGLIPPDAGALQPVLLHWQSTLFAPSFYCSCLGAGVLACKPSGKNALQKRI